MNLRDKHFQEALRELEQRRLNNKQVLNLRFAQIQQSVPEIFALREEYSEKSRQLIADTIENPSHKADNLKKLQQMDNSHRKQTANLLKERHLPSDYLQPIFHCPFCEDTGFLENQQICSCLKNEFIKRAYQQSNLASTFAKQNFANFSFEVYDNSVDKRFGISPRENMHTVYEECIQFSQNFGKNYQNLLLNGPSGLGKTFLCSCIAKEVLDREFSVIYLSAPEFFGYFEKYHFHHNESFVDYRYIEAIFDCDLLLLDDLGTEVISSVTQSDLFQTLNRRIAEQKCTVISTNFSVSQLSNVYSERIVSRILGEYTPLLFFGEDIRKSQYR